MNQADHLNDSFVAYEITFDEFEYNPVDIPNSFEDYEITLDELEYDPVASDDPVNDDEGNLIIPNSSLENQPENPQDTTGLTQIQEDSSNTRKIELIIPAGIKELEIFGKIYQIPSNGVVIVDDDENSDQYKKKKDKGEKRKVQSTESKRKKSKQESLPKSPNERELKKVREYVLLDLKKVASLNDIVKRIVEMKYLEGIFKTDLLTSINTTQDNVALIKNTLYLRVYNEVKEGMINQQSVTDAVRKYSNESRTKVQKMFYIGKLLDNYPILMDHQFNYSKLGSESFVTAVLNELNSITTPEVSGSFYKRIKSEYEKIVEQ